MNCEQARQALLDSLDGSIRAELGLHMEDHIATCETCHRFAEVQRMIDRRLTAAVPVASLSSAFRRSLQQKLNHSFVPTWPESLPDIAHLGGCALGIVLLLLVMPQYPRTVLLAGICFSAVTYLLQAVLRSSLEKLERFP